jgi:hypothetical protein
LPESSGAAFPVFQVSVCILRGTLSLLHLHWR